MALRTRHGAHRSSTRAAGLLLPLLLVAGLAGCGDDGATTAADGATDGATDGPGESSGPSESPDPSTPPTASEEPEPALPACDEVWTEGGRLPGGYGGCVADGREVLPASQPCSFGKPIVTYGDRWYAVPGGPVNRTERPLAEDDAYQQARASCGA